MTTRFNGAIALVLASIVGIMGSCSGGGGNTPDQILEEFDLIITANPDTGIAPLTVSFFAVPSGGIAPYTYAWDFDGDGVTDSNSSNGIHSYTASGTATVTVTDSDDKSVMASRTITVTQGTPQLPDLAMMVSFTAEPQAGNVPFGSQFNSFVQGGVAPYDYEWDFNNDGIFDSFERDPYWLFEAVGQEVLPGTYVVKPLLKVTDSQGVSTTNFEDNDNDGQPDWDFSVVVNPTLGDLTVTGVANPTAGQAPLTVEFTGATANGTGNYAYSWDFGDTNGTEFRRSSIATHTYLGQGTYKARVTVYDLKKNTIEPAIQQPRPEDLVSQATSTWITVNALIDQPFSLEITSDIVGGQVPFVVNFEAHTSNGTEPIIYHWDIFTDMSPDDDQPTISSPPFLNSDTVVTPATTFRKSPTVHFANVVDDGSYVARCVAQDATGSTAVSGDLIRIKATPNTTFPYYLANRPKVLTTTFFPINRGGTSSQANIDPPTAGTSWRARANPAVATHPTGISFIFGGEILDENGNFFELVSQGDAAYMYVPEQRGTTTGEGQIGKFSTNDLGGGLVHLNDGFSPPFPGPSDGPTMPPIPSEAPPPGFPGPGPQPTNRSTGFNIVGSAAAVFIHEVGYVETNSDGAYQSARNNRPSSWKYPDASGGGWGLDSPPIDTSGLGVPTIFVIGGRFNVDTPTDLVQKYYPYGFGTEDLYTQSIEFGFQTTSNQTDTWSTYFLRPDRDQWPDQELGPPDIDDRLPSSDETIMPVLPKAVFGLMAIAVETGVQMALPAWPGGPSRFIFTFGGIDENGSVQREMRWWDLAENGDQNEETDGVFSLVTDNTEEVVYMPTARAYGKAIYLPGEPAMVALIGGVTDFNIPLDTIDLFTFQSSSTGTWETFEGTLPEALEACGAGYLPGPGPERWVMAFGGWTGEDFNSDMYSVRVNSFGDLVIKEPSPTAPRSSAGSGQGGSAPLMIGFNRFVMIAGVDENGTDSVIEVFSLPYL